MKGFPKHINTKKDVMNCLKQWPAQTKAFLQRAIDNRYSWAVEGKLAEGESGITDDIHKVVEITDMETDVVTERYQHVWQEDQQSTLFRLGFTVSEAEGLLTLNSQS